MLFFDTSAWVEYFTGSPKGLKIKNMLESGEKVATPTVVLIELNCKAYKENVDFKTQFDFIKQSSVILNLNEDVIIGVGKIYTEMKRKHKKTSLADGIIAAMAINYNSDIVTCDTDFKGLDNIKFIS